MLLLPILSRKINVFAPKRWISVASKKFSSRNTAPESGIVAKEPWMWRKPEGHDTGITMIELETPIFILSPARKIKTSYYLQRKSRNKGKVPFIVRNPNYVTWYACGPTVYNSSHIGHAVTYLLFDVMRRIMTEYFGLKIAMVMGITNMDNKIINRALLNDMDIMELANKYEAEFKNDMKTLNVLPPTTYMRVTDLIPQIIGFIQTLLDRELAYTTDTGNVYLSYNHSPQNIAKLWEEFHEADPTEGEKRFIKDICLWKQAKGGEPYWDAPWGQGRPGWHIECSVMASMCFGDKVDIHTGGNDLRFPHHEYEIAQCDGFHGCYQWVDYFLHSGHLHVEKEKMSKSLGNFITIEDCVNEYGKDFLRMYCCRMKWYQNTEYRKSQIDMTLKYIEIFRNFFKTNRQYMSGIKRAEFEKEMIIKAIEECDVAILNCFKNNFNTKGVLNELVKLITITEQAVKQAEAEMYCDVSAIVRVTNYIDTNLTNLGFTFHMETS